jgi:aspartate/methionine/tyrosine aminotransferase
MARLRPLSWRDLVRILRALGFEGPFHGGEGSLRICYAAERSILEPAMERLGRFLRE